MDNEFAPFLPQVKDWLLRRVPASGIRRVVPVLAALSSDIGAVRKENQDRVALARGRDARGNTYVVAALADGIGGMKDGAGCAALTVSAVFDAVHRRASGATVPSEWAADAVKSAHQAVHMSYCGSGGATLVLLLLTAKEGIYWASVGDSRLYVSSGETLLQVSTDDTIAGQLGRAAEADIDQKKLLQFIGMGGPLEFEVSKLSGTAGNTALLTSDGVHFLASDSDLMSQVVRHAPDIGITARRLTELARWAGGPDNATVAIVSLDVGLYESPPSYACLDIWDPYGEIRIALIAREDQLPVRSDVTSTKSQPAKSKAPIKDLTAAETPTVDDVSAPTKIKGEKRKKGKRKPRAPRGTRAPEVQFDFSDKS